MTHSADKDARLTVGDLGPQHVGQRLAGSGLAQIQGWLPHLLLERTEHYCGETTLYFRWDDDPSPSNSKRGQFACGITIASDTLCRVFPPGVGQ